VPSPPSSPGGLPGPTSSGGLPLPASSLAGAPAPVLADTSGGDSSSDSGDELLAHPPAAVPAVADELLAHPPAAVPAVAGQASTLPKVWKQLEYVELPGATLDEQQLANPVGLMPVLPPWLDHYATTVRAADSNSDVSDGDDANNQDVDAGY
jgi:hypothetical protein